MFKAKHLQVKRAQRSTGLSADMVSEPAQYSTPQTAHVSHHSSQIPWNPTCLAAMPAVHTPLCNNVTMESVCLCQLLLDKTSAGKSARAHKCTQQQLKAQQDLFHYSTPWAVLLLQCTACRMPHQYQKPGAPPAAQQQQQQ
jgi:hypothetical protein